MDHEYFGNILQDITISYRLQKIMNTCYEVRNYDHKYHSIDACDYTLGADNLLAYYDDDRDEILDLVDRDIETLISEMWTSVLAVDHHCQCQLGQGNPRTPFSCVQCRSLARLVDFRSPVVNHPFNIEHGESLGCSLVITKHPAEHLFLRWDDEAVERARNYLTQYQQLQHCGSTVDPQSQYRCIAGDRFSIGCITWWLANRLLIEKEMPNIPILYDVFVCHHAGYAIVEHPTIGSIEDLVKHEEHVGHSTSGLVLRSDIARGIIYQLVAALKELMKINFSHGRPSAASLTFSQHPVIYKYDDVTIETSILLQLSNLWTSSCTVPTNLADDKYDIHFYSSDVVSGIQLAQSTFVPEISTLNNSSSDQSCSGGLYYRLTSSTLEIYHALQNLGFSLYVGTFDWYCFMTSLMCEQAFYNAVIHDPQLSQIWNIMWLDDDRLIIDDAVKSHHQTTESSPGNKNNRDNDIRVMMGFESVVDIIRGHWLRCNILECIWERIRTWPNDASSLLSFPEFTG